jgi:hypothetical protein
MERNLTPYLSIVFNFGLAVNSSRSVGVRHFQYELMYQKNVVIATMLVCRAFASTHLMA